MNVFWLKYVCGISSYSVHILLIGDGIMYSCTILEALCIDLWSFPVWRFNGRVITSWKEAKNLSIRPGSFIRLRWCTYIHEINSAPNCGGNQSIWALACLSVESAEAPKRRTQWYVYISPTSNLSLLLDPHRPSGRICAPMESVGSARAIVSVHSAVSWHAGSLEI